MTAGALAVSMIPPYYYKFSMDEIMGYYEDVIGPSPMPAIVYVTFPSSPEWSSARKTWDGCCPTRTS